MGLREYKRKRDFKDTTEPAGKVASTRGRKLSFVIQEHHATRLHFDFRLEMEGVLKSWAVPKGPSMNPSDKRLAMMVEDHPIEYGGFAGTIPEGNYGAGEVRIWDKGTYTPVGEYSAEQQLKREKLEFVMHGKKLKGEFHMFRMRTAKESNAWLLIKIKDKYSDPKWEMDQILDYGSRKEKPEGLKSKKVWISNREQSNGEAKTSTRKRAGSGLKALVAKTARKRSPKPALEKLAASKPKTAKTKAASTTKPAKLRTRKAASEKAKLAKASSSKTRTTSRAKPKTASTRKRS